MNSFYTKDELSNLGLKSFGSNVLISRKASIYNGKHITVGNNVRIDDFVILSGNITIGDYVHISAYSGLFANQGEIIIGNYCGISPRCTLMAASDDFSGEYMISPLVNKEFTNVDCGKIILNNFCQIGLNSCVMPNVILGEGSVIGACSLALKSLDEWTINIGIPCRVLKKRSKNMLNFLNCNKEAHEN